MKRENILCIKKILLIVKKFKKNFMKVLSPSKKLMFIETKSYLF
jgi:hypothetical protein